MAVNPNYPAVNLSQGSALVIENGNTLHNIINGAADETFEVADGTIASIRKSLVDNFYFIDPIDWDEGSAITVFNQLVKFTDGTLWTAPTARVSNPILMGATPHTDVLFSVAPFGDAASAAAAAQSASEAAISAAEAEEQVNLFASSSGIIISTNMIATQNIVLGFHPLY